MTKLIFKTLFQTRLKWVYYGTLILTWGMLAAVIFEGYDQLDYILYPDVYEASIYLKLEQVFPLISVTILSIFLIEHDQDIYTLLIPYRSRRYVYYQKLSSFMQLWVLYIGFTSLFIMIGLYIEYPRFQIDHRFFTLILTQLTEGIIVMLFNFLLIQKHRKMIALASILIVEILQLIQDHTASMLLFYLIPVPIKYGLDYTCGVVYILIYISMLLIILDYYYEKKDIYFK